MVEPPPITAAETTPPATTCTKNNLESPRSDEELMLQEQQHNELHDLDTVDVNGHQVLDEGGNGHGDAGKCGLPSLDEAPTMMTLPCDDPWASEWTRNSSASPPVVDNTFSREFMYQLYELYQTQSDLCDFTVICSVGDYDNDSNTETNTDTTAPAVTRKGVFRFPKVVLCFSSHYFRNLLLANPTLTSHNLHDYDLPAIDSVTFGRLAESFFTGFLPLSMADNDDNARESQAQQTRLPDENAVAANVQTALLLWRASFLLQVPHAQAQVTQCLLKALNPDNCLSIWMASRACSNPPLLGASTARLGRHLEIVANSQEFLDLKGTDVVDLLSRDMLQVPAEQVVYDAAMIWISKKNLSLQNDSEMIAQVLGCVRFPYLNKAFLTDVVAQEPLVTELPPVMKLYSQGLCFKLSGKIATAGAGDNGNSTRGAGPGIPKRRDHVVHQVRGHIERWPKFIAETPVWGRNVSAGGLLQEPDPKLRSAMAEGWLSPPSDFLLQMADQMKRFHKEVIFQRIPCIPSTQEKSDSEPPNPNNAFLATEDDDSEAAAYERLRCLPCMPKKQQRDGVLYDNDDTNIAAIFGRTPSGHQFLNEMEEARTSSPVRDSVWTQIGKY